MEFCAILLSYKRPKNISKILTELFKVGRINKIILSNNNPDIYMQDWLNKTQLLDKRLIIINQLERKHCIERFYIARKENYENFICPDDDIFLSNEQYDSLIDEYERQPNKVHGIRGQLPIFLSGELVLASGVSGVNAELDILNCLYLFSRVCCTNLFALSCSLELEAIDNFRQIDDILLSFSGDGRPICHDVGDVGFCETQDDPYIATWQEDGFQEKRINLYRKLRDRFV